MTIEIDDKAGPLPCNDPFGSAASGDGSEGHFFSVIQAEAGSEHCSAVGVFTGLQPLAVHGGFSCRDGPALTLRQYLQPLLLAVRAIDLDAARDASRQGRDCYRALLLAVRAG